MMRIKIYAIWLAIVLTLFTGTEKISGLVGNVTASSPEKAIQLMITSEPANQHAPTSGRPYSPSYLPPPQLTWQRLDFPILPLPRVGFAMALNSINRVALLFGGLNSSNGELNDLWMTNGLVWMQFHTPHSPEERSNTNLAYDEARRVAVLFGGMKNTTLLGDTWLFDGVDWIQQYPPASPSPRANASMAYDAARNLTVLFGGEVDTGGNSWEAMNEMWVWDGENWQQQFPESLPPARFGATMVFDRAHQSIILFGGAIGGGFREDTWLWNGINWIEQQPLHHPSGRANFGMVYDEGKQQVILFGGQSYADINPTETWAWDGQDWTQMETRQAPPQELSYGVQLVYLPDLPRVVLFNDFRQKTSDHDGKTIFIERSEVWALTDLYTIYLPVITTALPVQTK
jgi:hypothetical protein